MIVKSSRTFVASSNSLASGGSTHADELGLRDAPARHVGGAAGEVGVDVGEARGPQLLLHHLTQIPAPGHNRPDTGDTHNTLTPSLRLSQSTQELISESKIR